MHDAEAARGGALGRLRLQALADECDLDALEDAIERLLGQERIRRERGARGGGARPAPLWHGEHEAVDLSATLPGQR